MNWLKALAFLLVAVALGLFVAALVTPWYRVRHHDGTTTHMGLYHSYDDGTGVNSTDTDEKLHDMSMVFLAESSPTHPPSHTSMSTPIGRLAQLTSAQAEEQVVNADPDRAPDPNLTSSFQPSAPSSAYQRASSSNPNPAPTRRRQGRSTLDYDSGWVTAMRVLLILTIVVSFLLLCWTLYHAFVHGTSYGWDDGPYMTGTNYLGYMLLFWGFLNGIIILSLASSFGPTNRYDQGYAFNSVAFILLLLSMCVLCWPISTPVIVVSEMPGSYGSSAYYGGRQWGGARDPSSTTFGGPPFGKQTYASTDTTTPATTITAGTGTGTGTDTTTGSEHVTERKTQPFTQTADPAQMPTI